jgi:hypothetical protein
MLNALLKLPAVVGKCSLPPKAFEYGMRAHFLPRWKSFRDRQNVPAFLDVVINV